MTTRVRKSFLSTVALLALVLAISPAMAQEEAATIAGPNTGKVSFNLGADITTQYVFRGINQEDQGLIFQPYADATINLIDEGDNGFIKNLDFYFGTWNSVHSQDTGGTDAWYEADYFVGFSFGLTDTLSADISYIVLDSPNNSGLTVFAQEIDLALAYDDSALWNGLCEDFGGLQPYFLVAFEVDGGSDGQGGGFNQGTYFEFGIAPSCVVLQSETTPITLTVPVTLGLGSDYYEVTTATGSIDDDTFGFVDIGLDFSMPLTWVPADYGSWELSTGVHFLFLGDNTETINNGDGFEVIGTVGISMSY